MENGKEYKILFSKIAIKDKVKLKDSGLDEKCRKILNLMIDISGCLIWNSRVRLATSLNK